MRGHPRKYSLAPREVPRVQTANRRSVTRLPVPESVAILGRPLLSSYVFDHEKRAKLAGGSPARTRWPGRLDDRFVQVPFPLGFMNPDTRFELSLETLEKRGVTPDRFCGVMSESFQGAVPEE
jgi:hypothetical protein